MRTLLLDNTFFPVEVITWQKAIVLLFTGRAEIVDEYEDNHIQTGHVLIPRPKILRLFNRHKTSRTVKFTRINVFLRDNYTCQYCQTKLPHKDLTFDHVIAQSKGGPTSWENIVTCCRGCNTKKGNKDLKDTNLKLLKEPKEPNWHPSLCLKLKKSDPKEWTDWIPLKKSHTALS